MQGKYYQKKINKKNMNDFEMMIHFLFFCGFHGGVSFDTSKMAKDVWSVMPKKKTILIIFKRFLIIYFTFFLQVTGKCGSVLVRLIPAPRGTGIVSAPVPKKLLQMAGIDDCYTSSRGSTTTLGNFAKATYAAIAKTYAFLTPDLWKDIPLGKTPYQEHADFLSKSQKSGGRNIEI